MFNGKTKIANFKPKDGQKATGLQIQSRSNQAPKPI
jgi:hypothetical protein